MTINKILISRTDGIGDLLLTTALIHEVKLKYPSAKLTVLVSKYAKELLANNPDVDDVLIYDKNDVKTLITQLKSEKFDVVIAAYPRPKLAWIFFISGIPQRFGTGSRWYSIFYNKPVFMSRKKSEKSEADYNIMSAGKLLDEVFAKKEYYYLTEDEKKNGTSYVKQKNMNSDFIIIHPGSKGSAWNLSETSYAKLTNEILKNGYTVLLTGGKAEQDLILRIKEEVLDKQNLFLMNEELTMRQFAAVISNAKVLISGSTGPMHIAAAIGVKTLSFFPPDYIAAMRPKRWAPLGNIYDIIQPKGKHNKETAMDTIKIDEIINKLKELIAK